MDEFRYADPDCFTEEVRMMRDQVRRFVDEEVIPHGDQWEADGMVPRDIFKKLGTLGMLGMRHAVDYGGTDMGAVASVAFSEELGRSTYGGFSADILVHTDMSSTHIGRRGSEAQKQKYLPDLIAGEKVCAIAVTEPGAGSDVAGMRTTAERDGNDGYRLNGSKMFITNGVHGDVFIVAARTDKEVKPSRGISLFIVEKGTPGFTVAASLKKHGWRCSDTAELHFDNAFVPAENLLGEENKGFYGIMDNFQNERLVIGGMAVGESAKAIELTLDYVKTRQAFGGTLWDMQATRQKLASLAAKATAAQALLYQAAKLEDDGRDCVKEVSMVKAFCAETVQEIVHACYQLHGGTGYIEGTPIERMMRDARILTVGGGATEVMLEEVAKRM